MMSDETSSDFDRSLAVLSYAAVRRWHLLVGLFVAPLLILLALTGAIYLFDREIEAWWNRDYVKVAPGTAPLSLAVQEAAVRKEFPDARIGGVEPARDPDQANEWQITDNTGQQRTVFVDPYRDIVTGSVLTKSQPLPIVRRIHAGLMIEPLGRYLIELAACWTLVMLVTGLYLWWPNQWRWVGVLVPRLSAGSRLRWRDLHAIPASLMAAFLTVLILSGLPWSVFWGAQLSKIGEFAPFAAPSPQFGAPEPTAGTTLPSWSDPHALHRHSPDIPWTMQNTPEPQGSGDGIGVDEIETLLARLDLAKFGGGVRILYPVGPTGVFRISYIPDKAEGQRTIFVDPGNGKILGETSWQDYSPIAKAVEWGVMTHMGREYGTANQLFNLMICATLVGAISAGLVMWWRRRPLEALLGSPPRPGERLPRQIVGAITLIAILFPLVGVTLTLFLILRRLRRIQPSSLR